MRKLPALLSMIALALLLVACGNDDEESDPTAAPVEPTQAAEATEPATATSSVSTPIARLATPDRPVIGATPVASPVTAATPIASPVASIPVVFASPVTDATPEAGAVAVAGGASDADMRVLRGTVSLPGTINEAFVITDDGCVGLGRYAGVQAGQQVIVRDGQGTIVAVTELAAIESSVVCGWTFTADVPESEYYAISIPMAGERVYAGDDVAAADGEIELVLP